MATYKFEYPSIMESEEKMLSNLAALLIDNNIQNPLRYEFMLVISEAFTNALLHGNQLDESKKIFLTVTIKPNQLTADIIDEGALGVKQIKTKKPSELYGTNGRGIDLINHYSTEVNYSEAKNGGTKVSVLIDKKLEKIT